MELSDKLLRSFTDIIRSSQPREKKQNPTVKGTAVKEGLNTFVYIDGSDIKTPASTLVGVETGDRVDVLIQNHKAVVTGNHTNNAITRFGDVYITMSESGIIVGKLDEDEQPSGASILIDPISGEFKIVDADGEALAKFGRNAQLGRNDRPHSVTTDTAFVIKDANDNDLASFGATSTVSQLRSKRSDVIPDNGRDATSAVTARDENGNVRGNGRMLATNTSGRFGLYDTNQSDWLIYSELSGEIHAKITPIELRRDNASPSTVSSEAVYTNVPTPNLSKYSMVVIYCRVGSTYTSLTFIRGGPTERFISFYNNGRLVRGSFMADWDNNRFRIRCVNGNDGDQSLVSMNYVFGILTR